MSERIIEALNADHTCGFDRNSSHTEERYVEYECAKCDIDEAVASLIEAPDPEPPYFDYDARGETEGDESADHVLWRTRQQARDAIDAVLSESPDNRPIPSGNHPTEETP